MRPEVSIKTGYEIQHMRESGRLLADVFAQLDQWMVIGANTLEINQQVEQYICHELSARPASLGAYGYPFAINVSPNNVACHGMPDEERNILSSDIVNIDITLEKNGFIVDSNKTYVFPDAKEDARRLTDIAYQAMWEGIKQVRPGNQLGNIGHAIQTFVEANNCSVVREFCGHGIGRVLHEAPQILHYGLPHTGLVLQEGMTFTIEPVVNLGTNRVVTLKDGWTVVTCDDSLSAQFEHTILVTASGAEVLTLRKEEPQDWRTFTY
ncbi:type I methionyl aminopeptidase [Vibrio nitrifigilis]|uniref:Methionine aminopeptidase n=1 Tax=Vibrio nitrifigilis TaxID=2789781 RepID=A0ABS0GJD9_9VIBR|nr:type I methionyl aminopeptidase [Vibrio nitrifigilis]MBF9002553.1 type I methionyl aminopeptidase [Vibrio nitrifigilis]